MSGLPAELTDSLVSVDDDALRTVVKTYRMAPSSYPDADWAATAAGWVGEPAGKRSSRIVSSRKDKKRRWVLRIEFSTVKGVVSAGPTDSGRIMT